MLFLGFVLEIKCFVKPKSRHVPYVQAINVFFQRSLSSGSGRQGATYATTHASDVAPTVGVLARNRD